MYQVASFILNSINLHLQDFYGVDWQGPVSEYEDVEHVKVPSTT